MSYKILVTGAYGFLGRHTAKHFNTLGYEVYALGHGVWQQSELDEWGVNHWLFGDVTLDSIQKMKVKFDLIVHCAGGGSVAFSMNEPMKDFQRSVESTLAVLEYMRLYNPEAKLIYPSSPAVQGVHADMPIKEDDDCNPVSPYGVHKKMAEDLCLSFAQHFSLDVSIIRFFSIYGDYLQKQLLWDAANKLMNHSEESIFWGTGNETRDWIHVDDAVSLIACIANTSDMPAIINGGSGKKQTINETLTTLNTALGTERNFTFNLEVREGDPKYYWSDITNATSIGWEPKVIFEDGVRRYAKWFKEQQ